MSRTLSMVVKYLRNLIYTHNIPLCLFSKVKISVKIKRRCE